MKGKKKKSNNRAKSLWFYIERASILLVFWFILHGCPIDPILEYVPAYVIHFLFSIPWLYIVWYGLKACQLILKIKKKQISQRQTKTNYCFPNSNNIINTDKLRNTVSDIRLAYGITYKSKDDSVINGPEDYFRITEDEFLKKSVYENRYLYR